MSKGSVGHCDIGGWRITIHRLPFSFRIWGYDFLGLRGLWSAFVCRLRYRRLKFCRLRICELLLVFVYVMVLANECLVKSP